MQFLDYSLHKPRSLPIPRTVRIRQPGRTDLPGLTYTRQASCPRFLFRPKHETAPIPSAFSPKQWTAASTIRRPAGRAGDSGPPTPPERPSTLKAAKEPPARCCTSNSARTRWRTDVSAWQEPLFQHHLGRASGKRLHHQREEGKQRRHVNSRQGRELDNQFPGHSR